MVDMAIAAYSVSAPRGDVRCAARCRHYRYSDPGTDTRARGYCGDGIKSIGVVYGVVGNIFLGTMVTNTVPA